MSDERDELALELFIGDNANQPRESSVQDWTWMRVTGKQQGSVEHYKAMAAHALAAGYRRPRTITTVDDLYALPSGSILLSHSEYPHYTGTVWRVSGLGMIGRVGREVDGVTPLRYFKDPLPVTVLHKPEAQP